MSNKIQRITVKAIIYKNNSFLLVQDHKGRWEMPGGKIDFGEDPKDTLRRELNEELGLLHIEIKDVVNVWTFSVSIEEGDYQFVVVVFEVTSEDINIKKSDEHKECKWVPINEIDSLYMRDGYKESMHKFLLEKSK